MNLVTVLGILGLTTWLGVGATSQRERPPPPPSVRIPYVPVPNISGVWYMHGDPDLRCEIVQKRLDGRALFINEHGSSAWGTVQGHLVSIPDWTDGRTEGLVGRIRGDRIIWPNGTFWER